MHAQINQLVRSLLQKESLDECSVQELQQFADRHPYFGAAQLLLTKKLKSENSDRYNAQLQKTFLFFHNPLWVENLLSDAGEATVSSTATISGHIPNENMTDPGFQDQETLEPEPGNEMNEKAAMLNEENAGDFTGEADVDLAAPPFSIAAIKEEFDAPAKDTDLVFEPYHTVDYFASQGIREKEELKEDDKFGRQLKSFTAWLKTMKRVPGTNLGIVSEPASEQKVDELAEHSIKERDVITEAMALVWEKQGNLEKARAVYEKLSLLEPGKSAYFAAKIEDLKKIS